MASLIDQKEDTNDNKALITFTKEELLNSRSLPKNYGYSTHKLPSSMYSLFCKPILSELEPDPSFTYLPLLTRYQISTKSYCDLCYGLLENYHLGGAQLHIQTAHNYACPNNNCEREFVLKSHLKIHLKICKQSQKLPISSMQGMNDKQYEQHINYTINSPINNYYKIVKNFDVNPTNEWIEMQWKWREKRTKKKRKNSKKHSFNNQKHKKRKLNNELPYDIKKENNSMNEIKIKKEIVSNNYIKISDINSNKKTENDNDSFNVEITDEIIFKKEIKTEPIFDNNMNNINNENDESEEEDVDIIKDNLDEVNNKIMILEDNINIKCCPKCYTEALRTDEDINSRCSLMVCKNKNCGNGKDFTYWCWDCSHIININHLSFNQNTNEPVGACRNCRKMSRKTRNKCKIPVYK